MRGKKGATAAWPALVKCDHIDRFIGVRSYFVFVSAGCTSQDPDLHQHRKMVKEKPMAEREVGKGTWVTDRIGRQHYVWPEEGQSPE